MRIQPVILAGGMSRRMGRDKAKLYIDGKTMLAGLIEEFSHTGRVIVSIGAESGGASMDSPKGNGACAEEAEALAAEYGIERELAGKVVWVRDLYPGAGPMAGIQASLDFLKKENISGSGSEERTAGIFTVACDMPYADKRLMDILEKAWKEGREAGDILIAIPVDAHSGKKHYVAGIYGIEIEEAAKGLLETGERRLGSLVEKFEEAGKVKTVNIDSPLILRALKNINEPEEFREIDEAETPVFAFGGISGSGKTTLIRGVTDILKDRGYRISYIKHTHHDIDLPKDKDSTLIYEAGAVSSQVVSDESRMVVERGSFSLQQILEKELKRRDIDMIILEGFKTEYVSNRITLKDGKIGLSWKREEIPMEGNLNAGEDPGDKNIAEVSEEIEKRWKEIVLEN